jgi:hypothetical protein
LTKSATNNLDSMLQEYASTKAMNQLLEAQVKRLTETAIRFNSILAAIAHQNADFITITKDDIAAVDGKTIKFLTREDEDGSITIAMVEVDKVKGE